MTAEKEKDGVESISCNRAHFFLRYFSEGQSSTALKINIVGEGEGGQSLEWGASKEVGCGSV